MNSDVIGLRLGTTRVITELGVRSFSGTRYGTTYDDTLFASVRLDHNGTGLDVSVDRYNTPRIRITAENVFEFEGVFSIDFRNAIGPVVRQATFTLAYTTGIGDGDTFSPALRRRVLHGDYYDEVVREEGFPY